MLSDPIADMLTRIRNAGKAQMTAVDIPASQMKAEMAKVLKDEGYIKNYKYIKDSKQGILRIFLKYAINRKPVIYGIERVSKPSRRVYTKAKDIQPVLNGMGIAVVSTSKGIMTDKKARQENIGGEIICNVW
jgi:small subunit ribosomal protein S8